MTVTLSQPGNGVLVGGVSGSYDPTTGVYSLSGSPTDVTAALQALTFVPTDHQVAPGETVSTTFTLGINDGHVGVVIDSTTTVNATAVNDPPLITGTAAGQAIADNGSLHPFAGVQVVDVDFGKTESVTVTLSQPGNGALVGGVSGSYDPTTGVYSLSGSPTDVTAALQALTFVPTDHQVAPGETVSTTFTLGINDGHGGVVIDSTTTVNATAVNDPPLITGTAAGQAIADNGSLHPFAGVQVVDVDFGKTESVTVTLSQPGNGALVGGVSGSYDLTTGVYSLSGSPTDVTAALQALTFVPTDHQVAPGETVSTTFTLGINDGHGGVVIDSTTTVNATAVNDPPLITGTAAGQAIADNGSLHPFAGVQVVDVDFGKTESVTVTLSQPGNGALVGGVSGSYDPTTGVYSLSGSPTDVTAALQALTFVPTDHQVAPGETVSTTFTLGINDGHGGVVIDSTTTVNATAVNDPPLITGTAAGQAIADNGSLHPFAGVQVVDVDFGKTESVTVTLSQPGNGALVGGVSGSYDPTTGVYSLSGSPTDVTAALQALTFVPTDHQVAPGETVSTTFTLGINDGHGGVVIDSTTTVNATAVNDPPLITGTAAGQAIADNGSLHPFAGVQVVDVDFGKTESVTVTLNSPQLGHMRDLGGGAYDNTTGVYSVSGSAAHVTAVLRSLVFNAAAATTIGNGVLQEGFTIVVSDNQGGLTTDSSTTVVIVANASPPGSTEKLFQLQQSSEHQLERLYGRHVGNDNVAAVPLSSRQIASSEVSGELECSTPRTMKETATVKEVASTSYPVSHTPYPAAASSSLTEEQAALRGLLLRVTWHEQQNSSSYSSKPIHEDGGENAFHDQVVPAQRHNSEPHSSLSRHDHEPGIHHWDGENHHWDGENHHFFP